MLISCQPCKGWTAAVPPFYVVSSVKLFLFCLVFPTCVGFLRPIPETGARLRVQVRVAP